jgi:hypothetical protein
MMELWVLEPSDSHQVGKGTYWVFRICCRAVRVAKAFATSFDRIPQRIADFL